LRYNAARSSSPEERPISPPARLLRRLSFVLLALHTVLPARGAAGDVLDDRQRRCLTMIAYAEAASEGPAGMAAVMRVVRNRLAHPSFPKDICAVALQDGQFQPVSERPALRRALTAPEGQNLSQVLGATSRAARLTLVQAWRLAVAAEWLAPRDPTGGALYFVNPHLMDPGKCPWFAGLKRTAAIGQHVFMTHYAPGEPRGAPALDCALAGKGRGGSARVAAAEAHGLFDPRGPKIPTRPVPPATLRAWSRTGELAKRQTLLRRHFQPGWRDATAP
jgi:hypothetical protein